MKTYISALLILIALLWCGAAATAGKKSSFKGRIAAYRPADRMQVVSSVINKEQLLFQKDAASQDLLKIVYVHQGFSDLKGGVISGTQEISVSSRRDASCDETLGAFEMEAPAIPIEGGGRSSSTERVVFASWVSRPPESYRLTCYVLEHWRPVRGDESSKPAKLLLIPIW